MMQKLVFIGDVHLDRDDAALQDFLHFMDRLAETTKRVILMGDLFNLWIGRRELEQPHHVAVIERLAALRRRGAVVRYLEGNRDYRIGECYAGSALDDASDSGLVERHGGHSIFAIHGDLANVADRQYRIWRRFSRSRAVWGLIGLVPRRRRLGLAESLERRMRGTNLAHKREFPEALVRSYAAPYFRAGHDIVVLGHFHLERDLPGGPGVPSGRILVLPEWKGSRRHLEIGQDGSVAFIDSFC